MNTPKLYEWQQKLLDDFEKKSKEPLVYIGRIPYPPKSALYVALVQAMFEYSKKNEKK